MSGDKMDIEAIIRAVKSPLGLITLIVLTIDLLLIPTAAVSEEVSIWAPFVLLGMVLIAVSLLAYYKPEGFYPPSEWEELRILRKERKERSYRITLIFEEPQKATPPASTDDFAIAKCQYSVFSDNHKVLSDESVEIHCYKVRYGKPPKVHEFIVPYIDVVVPKECKAPQYKIKMHYEETIWRSDTYDPSRGKVNME
ncbi:MAG: hypothetical protein ACFFB3_21410 [Candidatus Hodarchaeota archaeon]